MDTTFSASGRFFKGNLHTHSNLSDGALAPVEVCQRYQDAGYDFIALTDHFIGPYNYPITDTASFRNNQFTTILGAELHSGAMQNGELWHILAVGLPTDFTPSNSPGFEPIENQETGPDIARRARQAGAFVAIAHPEWSCLTEQDAMSIDAAHAVEIYNHGCAVECDRPRGLHTLDHLLRNGRRLTLCATDDAHFHVADHFGGWVMVKAEANEPDLLLEALKIGNYYSSQGPVLKNVVWEKDQVTVQCSPVQNVALLGTGCSTSSKTQAEITEVTLPFNRVASSPWKRIAITDSEGKCAWSNPIWQDELT